MYTYIYIHTYMYIYIGRDVNSKHINIREVTHLPRCARAVLRASAAAPPAVVACPPLRRLRAPVNKAFGHLLFFYYYTIILRTQPTTLGIELGLGLTQGLGLTLARWWPAHGSVDGVHL